MKFFSPQCSSVNIELRLYHLSVRSLELKIFTCDIRVKWWSWVSLKKLWMFRLILSFIKQTTLRLHTFILVMCCCHCSNYFLLILFYDFIYKQRTKWNKLIYLWLQFMLSVSGLYLTSFILMNHIIYSNWFQVLQAKFRHQRIMILFIQ